MRGSIIKSKQTIARDSKKMRAGAPGAGSEDRLEMEALEDIEEELKVFRKDFADINE